MPCTKILASPWDGSIIAYLLYRLPFHNMLHEAALHSMSTATKSGRQSRQQESSDALSFTGSWVSIKSFQADVCCSKDTRGPSFSGIGLCHGTCFLTIETCGLQYNYTSLSGRKYGILMVWRTPLMVWRSPTGDRDTKHWGSRKKKQSAGKPLDSIPCTVHPVLFFDFFIGALRPHYPF